MQKLRNTANTQASGAMGDNSGDEYVLVGVIPPPRVDNFKKKNSLLPLVFLIFYEVSGGPFGVEDTVELLVLF